MGNNTQTCPRRMKESEWLIDVIDDPLAWQEMMDSAPASINMRGSARFWATVAEMGIEMVYRDGTPEFSEIVFRLQDNIGLRLWTEEVYPRDEPLPRSYHPHIRFAFCVIEDAIQAEADHP